MNSRKRESMVAIKRKRTRCELRIGDIRFQKVRIFRYLENVLADDGTYDTEI